MGRLLVYPLITQMTYNITDDQLEQIRLSAVMAGHVPIIDLCDKIRGKKLVMCDCDISDNCPQGKTGMATKCKIWKKVD